MEGCVLRVVLVDTGDCLKLVTGLRWEVLCESGGLCGGSCGENTAYFSL